MKPLNITIAGAGSVGCFTGGLLALAGHQVTLLGRTRTLRDIDRHGLRLTDFAGLNRMVPSNRLILRNHPETLAAADLIIVAVKSVATMDMAANIAMNIDVPCPVLSFQNGIKNAARLRKYLPDWDVRPAVVPFNIVPLGDGRYHRASSGDIVLGPPSRGRASLADQLSSSDLIIRESDRVTDIQWGKLLLNLSNAVNALSGLPLREQLLDRAWRRLLADQMAEALAVYRASGVSPVSPVPVPVAWLPALLRLPTPVFRRLATAMVSIDPMARLSMAQDLDAGKPTEIDDLQGEILRTASICGPPAPLCQVIYDAVRAAERTGPAFRRLTPDDLRAGGDHVI